MSESSFSKGLSGGCGVITAIVIALVLLPILSCLFFGTCAGIGASNSTSSSSHSSNRSQSESAAATPFEVDESPTERVEPDTDCGRLDGEYNAVGNVPPHLWEEWRCASYEEQAHQWDHCLSRQQYSHNAGRGCPGDQRCCPPL